MRVHSANSNRIIEDKQHFCKDLEIIQNSASNRS